ncbi:YhgE/Pip family protein [Microbacterium sp. BG28]|uniref:YhgE/Pip family protein n=1 Tax=Microbacterium sp. BG28 TaxID=3097356 RepID=UPI002A5AF77C|nr:YhgE/Pip family protein [Microbacterium sp. BG28]MDY0827824.1 YhgE/Pip family protein [Microbacterium sp. BG28]
MTVPIERSHARRPVTWLTVLGIVLLPVVIGGLLVTALYNPVERLENMSAAIVNDDKPVEINGQLAPLGRQLTAGLVEGSSDVPSNIDWTISNDEDAAAGLADGTYSAVITIPENFSAAATSTAPGSTPEQATISVESAPDGRVVDQAITAQITQTAASVFGSAVSKQYLTNVLLGFTTLHDQLGDAANGAQQLADGSASAAQGATELSSGVGQLATGADQLASGAAQAATGAAALPGGAQQLASGARQLSDGAGKLAVGLDNGTNDQPDLKKAAEATVTAAKSALTQTQALGAKLGELVQDCYTTYGPTAPLCAELLTTIGDKANPTPNTIAGIGTAAGTAAGYGDGVVAGVSEAAGGARDLQSGAGGLATGADQLAAGAAQLSSGVSQLAGGASSLASGANQASTGATSLADGVTQLSSGAGSLATGLDTAVDQVPTYTDEQAQQTASVVAEPVSAQGIGSNLFGAAAIPLLTALVLWFGGLGSYVAFQAVSARALTSRRSSVTLALRAFAPGAVLGAVQGLLVAGVVQLAASYDWADWSIFAAICVVAGISFAAVNQALVAVFGGAGRWIGAIIGAFIVATGVVSTVPGVLTSIASVLPVQPAYAAMLGALTSAGGVTAGITLLVVWLLLSLVATTIVVSRRRTVSARAALA